MLKGHTGKVNCVVFSLDGKRVASASDDGTMKVWDAVSGQEMLTVKGNLNGVMSVAFSPDGKQLASDAHHSVKVWDATSGQEVLTFDGGILPARIHRVAFSPDGKLLASSSFDQTVKVWDAAKGEELLTLKGHADGVRDVAFSPDGKRIASAGMDSDPVKTVGTSRLVKGRYCWNESSRRPIPSCLARTGKGWHRQSAIERCGCGTRRPVRKCSR